MKKNLISIMLSLSLLMSAGAVYAKAEGANKAPTVIPAIREWNGGSGKYKFKNEMNIELRDGATLSDGKKKIITEYFSDLFSIKTTFTEESGEGDIILTQTSDDSLGKDGYTLDITSKNITIGAGEEIGYFYGIITLLQSNLADGYIPCGSAKDYSEYEIRSGMLDVARAWIPLDYVKDITKYLAWFKLNEIHLHVSETIGGFRLESNIEGLAVPNEYYTKDEYRAYQKEMLEYGIEVVTEIDTPAHAACFANVVPADYMLDSRHLDIRKPEVIEFVKNLLDEYITGDDPVFVSKRVHIGTDEYPEGYNEYMRAYTDTLLKHVKSRGYIPRFWGAFGGTGFNGTTKVMTDAEANYWAVYLSDYNVLLDMGYDIINTCGPALYIVPGGNDGFSDYYDLEKLYKTWQVNYLGINSSSAIDPKHPQLKGAGFALWNDLHQRMYGISIYDIFDRLRGAVCLMAEKTWCGSQTEKMEYSDFERRFNALSSYCGNSDPGYHRYTEIEGDIPDGAKAFGWPYVASMKLKVGEIGKEELLLSGAAGELYIDRTGALGFRREAYDFKYKFKAEAGKEYKIELIADEKETLLRVDGVYYYAPVNMMNSEKTLSSTFVLPLEKISEDVTDFKVRSEKIDTNSLLANSNLALGKKVTVSGLEVNDGRFTAELAVDGDESTRLSFARDKDEQWLIIDLGEERQISKAEILFNEHIPDYSICVSTDGKDFKEVARIQKGVDRQKQLDTVEFDEVNARYVRYEQHKRFYIADWNAYYSGGICEIRIFGYNEGEYKKLIDEATEILKEQKVISLQNAVNALEGYMKEEKIYSSHIKALAEKIQNEIDLIKNPEKPTEETSAEEITAPENKKPFPIGAVAAGCIALAAIVAGIIIFKKKKKK